METNLALALFVLALVFYLLPTFVAACRGHHNTMAIFALNLLLGWTMLGWIGALIWSFTATRQLCSND
jgi:hypothetical protein